MCSRLAGKHHDISGQPWIKVEMDILTRKNKDYFLLVDYYSDFFECEALSGLQSKNFINKTMLESILQIIWYSSLGAPCCLWLFAVIG